MKKTSTFGNAELAKKIVSQFGTSQKTVKAEMRYTKEVQTFILKVEEAHKKAAKSKLIFD
ncbi:MAG: hypothetical protein U9O82_00265 [Thermodesulfobacteriota bacterium]|nr:hypothetical protein [Thermodesulfobacteriota bacterium]